MQRKHNSRIYEHGTSNEEKQNKKDNDDLIDDVCQFTGSTSDAVRKSVLSISLQKKYSEEDNSAKGIFCSVLTVTTAVFIVLRCNMFAGP